MKSRAEPERGNAISTPYQEDVVLLVCDMYGTACEPASARGDIVLQHHQVVIDAFLRAMKESHLGEDSMLKEAPVFIEGDRIGFRIRTDKDGKAIKAIREIARTILVAQPCTTIAVSKGQVTVAPVKFDVAGDTVSTAIVAGEAVTEMDRVLDSCPMGAAISGSAYFSVDPDDDPDNIAKAAAPMALRTDPMKIWRITTADSIDDEDLSELIYDEAIVKRQLLNLYSRLTSLYEHVSEFTVFVQCSYDGVDTDLPSLRTFVHCLESLLSPPPIRIPSLMKMGIDISSDPPLPRMTPMWTYMAQPHDQISRLREAERDVHGTFLAGTEPVALVSDILKHFSLPDDIKEKLKVAEDDSDTLKSAEWDTRDKALIRDQLAPLVEEDTFRRMVDAARTKVQETFALHKSQIRMRQIGGTVGG